MPRALSDYLGLAVVLVCALVLLCAGAAVAFFFGLAWAVIALVVAGWLMSRLDMGQNGEGSYVIVVALIILAVGVAGGLLLRQVTP